MASDILIVDDEADIRGLVAGILEDEGHQTRTAGNADEALQAISERRPSMIFLDIWLQGSRLDGMEILDQVIRDHPDLPIVMISGHGNVETAVLAIRKGAYDFIEKPFKADQLILVAERALENLTLKREVRQLRQKSGEDKSRLIGTSTAMIQLKQVIERVGPTNSRILISGPSGTGKELVARSIHDASLRKDGPFLVINAASITPDGMELELFGAERGGEIRKVGALEQAHGGTLYIEEVADMPRETQNKILRVLVEQSFNRVGGAKKVKVDVRILSSSARNLSQDIEAGHFREDLYHRLAVVPVQVPALSERREDIPALVEHFIYQLSSSAGLPRRRISDEVLAILQAHDWAGNVRQLRNNVERLLILCQGDDDTEITPDMLPAELGEMVPSATGNNGEYLMALPLRDAREAFERDYLSAQINRFGGNISRTAEFVGMERSALHRKLKTLGIN